MNPDEIVEITSESQVLETQNSEITESSPYEGVGGSYLIDEKGDRVRMEGTEDKFSS